MKTTTALTLTPSIPKSHTIRESSRNHDKANLVFLDGSARLLFSTYSAERMVAFTLMYI